MIVDTDDYIAAGIKTMFFSGGEPHVKLPPLPRDTKFYAKLRTWNDVGLFALVLNGFHNQAPEGSWGLPKVFMPYFPGARQDRREDGKCGFTLELMKQLFQHTDLTVFDGHSPKLTEYQLGRNPITNFGWDKLKDKYKPYLYATPLAAVIAPDEGAVERADNFRRTFCEDVGLIRGTKVRDPQTGALSNYKIPPLRRIGHYIVVDDICDGGGTFNLLIDALKEDPFGRLSTFELVVSHGIFSKGIDNISNRFEKITTTDSWWNPPPISYSRLKVIPLKGLLEYV